VQDVLYQPVPAFIVIEPSQFIGCLPAEIIFTNLSNPIDETYDITWTFGDGGISKDISPSYVFENEGIFSVNLEIVSPIGCETSATFPSWIKILPKPTADFSFSPAQPNILEKEVDFIDQSIDAVSWQWDFNGEAVAFDSNPTYTFQDSGVVFITLLVKHESGCTDTLTKEIDVLPLTYLYFPNAFTPNYDSLNDEFIGKGFYDGLKSYYLSVWNRWGEKIFETTDPSEGWNGKKNNTGADAPQDVYVYIAKYVGPRGNEESLKGNITLIR
jgi:gliding motility-associated-like protein